MIRVSEAAVTQAPIPQAPKKAPTRKDWFESLFKLHDIRQTATISIRVPYPYKAAYDALTIEEKAYIKDRLLSLVRGLYHGDSDGLVSREPTKIITLHETIKPEDLVNTVEAAAEKCVEKLVGKMKTSQLRAPSKDIDEIMQLVTEIRGLIVHELPLQLSQYEKSKVHEYTKSKLLPKLQQVLEKLEKLKGM